MTVFVDTGVFYAQQDEDTERHDAATRAMRAIAGGRFGRPVTSDYVYDETVTLTLSRSNDPAQAAAVGDRIRGHGSFPEAVRMLFVGHEQFHDAIEIRRAYDDQALSFTDATTVAVMRDRGIDHVLSFDDDFDGILDRLDPTTL
ncbi:type II toxin-antitoxin system VapC family toxin [Haloarcula halophila]|uniref:type II toxin-antitoxin system VapC family toxin n=1 Tax=Haloarcula TaxID=2237 RepID=UPI0023E37B09|nr:type II toxin-antitoxin system VapC family toxin [Halomicroarcula sp. DFY41]